ncbi:ABC transporter ATP-binding protein [Rhodococcoides kyotonense]|uniref:Iron complex transport system ATP-binding protein n=1 Tax=Rhodococcoides kyotonense TaxID=398843 RepID=A0A239H273_9NOCA|nr:ABC transporter ATP-binding protein [Rhodococcus kyotonensis]SNS75576.1 iron complex transport system ATP-binding protein [Rhodococcus kyotonensis]
MNAAQVHFDGVSMDIAARRIISAAQFTAESGTIVGVLGRNGSGKSTLLRALYRAATPVEGEAWVNDRAASATRPRHWAQVVAVMGQEMAEEGPITVRETVALGRTPHHRGFGGDTAEDRRIVAEAMLRVGVSEFADRRMSSLSGGEKQRVRLARALAQQTPVLVLDEPTNHLDASHRYELLDLVRALGKTTLLAIHDLELALRYCDSVVVLAGGGVAHVGPPTEVLETRVLREVFDIDAYVHVDAATDSAFLHIHGAAGRSRLARTKGTT